jgi:hypothetical protein
MEEIGTTKRSLRPELRKNSFLLSQANINDEPWWLCPMPTSLHISE